MTGKFCKVTVLIALSLCSAMLFAGCGGSGSDDTVVGPGLTSLPGEETPTSAAGQEFTAAELAEFDGQDGRPAYVAVDGVVYDVSGGPDWVDGEHTRCGLGASAGRDLSDVILQAPGNMRALLQQMPVVGILVE